MQGNHSNIKINALFATVLMIILLPPCIDMVTGHPNDLQEFFFQAQRESHLRNNFIEWTSMVPAMPSPLGEIADLHLNGLPAQNRSDPSYQRPLVNRRTLNVPS